MYSPKIKPDLVKKLYYISKEKGRPMTKVVDGIIREGIAKIEEKPVTYNTKEELNNGNMG
jgi:hypothetical protein